MNANSDYRYFDAVDGIRQAEKMAEEGRLIFSLDESVQHITAFYGYVMDC